MNKIYLDIMVKGRFYRQIPYEFSPLFKIDYEDMLNFVLRKCPSLKGKNDWSIMKGRKVFR